VSVLGSKATRLLPKRVSVFSASVRLVCADGGNPDPTKTHGKNVTEAKQLKLAGWDYPRHLAGRLFAIAVHGDTEGAENVRRGLSDWLFSMELEAAGHTAEFDRYIGYWKPYATAHDDLDADTALQLVARTLIDAVGFTPISRN
jgi:hypothetical protein